MATMIDVVFGQLKAAGEALQKLIETRDAIKIGEIKAALLAKINAAHNAASALQEENADLKRRIAEFDNFQIRKARYELKTLPPGIIICSLKQGMDDTQDPQRACHTCYENGKIFALHRTGIHGGFEDFMCNGCGAKLCAGESESPSPVSRRGTHWSA